MWLRAAILSLFAVLLGAEEWNAASAESLTDRRNFRGNAQLYYYGIETPDASADAYATSLGGRLGYKSHLYYRFGIEAEYAGSNAVGNTKNYEKLYLFNNDKPSRHLNVLSQGNVYYQNPTTYFRLGAQTVNTPLFNEDPTRIVPWSAAGATMTYNRVDQLTVTLAAFDTIRSNTSAVYRKESASGPIDHGLYFLGGSYYLSNEHWLLGYYYLAPNLYDSLYLQYEYRRTLGSDFLFCLGVQYIRTFTDGGDHSKAVTDNAVGGDDVDLAAFKLSTDYHDLQLQLAYSENSGESGINNGYGGLSKVYTSSMIANSRKNKRPETWSLKTAYDIWSSPHWGTTEAAVWLTKTDYRDLAEGDFFSTYVHLRQTFAVNSTAFLRWERVEYKGSADATFLRLILKQSF